MLPEWSGTNAFCIILVARLLCMLDTVAQLESAPRMVWNQCFLHYPGYAADPCWAPPRNWEMLPEWSVANGFRIIIYKLSINFL